MARKTASAASKPWAPPGHPSPKPETYGELISRIIASFQAQYARFAATLAPRGQLILSPEMRDLAAQALAIREAAHDSLTAFLNEPISPEPPKRHPLTIDDTAVIRRVAELEATGMTRRASILAAIKEKGRAGNSIEADLKRINRKIRKQT